jgi:hypothetical protein
VHHASRPQPAHHCRALRLQGSGGQSRN